MTREKNVKYEEVTEWMSIFLKFQAENVLVAREERSCSTTIARMIIMLKLQCLKHPHYKYKFLVTSRTHRISVVLANGRCFYLPLHLFVASFHLPLHPWFVEML
ncbi:hypothetical protein J1N35_009048 [Gossypium stocksii]|uniref:Uncharacterized protein n=1 Tax=Gossypium stocksii TaxID=47602 RepID=A0A9D3WBD5_9ROSI|nr:hypothetical protein J1N35_009048 [Gossypium stocksii]